MRRADASPTVTYYNDDDPWCVAWLDALVSSGVLPYGPIDSRSITAVSAADLRGFRACHFFAGIGGWAEALRLAAWPDTIQVWTGSCCQPFSNAGLGRGATDARHLWPEWYRLICECRPTAILGEQTAGARGLDWLDVVRADLEDAGYAVAAAGLPACGVGAPHRRQRLWFVADRGVDLTASGGRAGIGTAATRRESPEPSPGPWSRVEWIACADGRRRPIEPGILPLAYGVPGRMGRLRGYGNAIVPAVAALFIRAYLDARAGVTDQPELFA